MLVSFLESIKHVGHIYPVALLRIYLGYHYLNLGFDHLKDEFLTQPRLAATIVERLAQPDLPHWYTYVLQFIVVPNWQLVAYFITYCYFIIGISLLIGFMVRPVSLLGVFLTVNFIYAGVESAIISQQTFLILFIVLFWIGAGRCLGVDYYFYKRQRGLWW